MPITCRYDDPVPGDVDNVRVEIIDGQRTVVGEQMIRSLDTPAPHVSWGVRLREDEIPEHISDALDELRELICAKAKKMLRYTPNLELVEKA